MLLSLEPTQWRLNVPFVSRQIQQWKQQRKKKFSLIKDKNTGELKLVLNHQYFYKVQTESGVYGLQMGNLEVWTEKDLYIESIQFNETLWKSVCLKAGRLSKRVILPELVGKWFTRQMSQVLSDRPTNEQLKML